MLVQLLIIFALPVRGTLLGLCTSESVILSAPQSLALGSILVSDEHPSLMVLHPRSSTILAIEGDPSDCDELITSIREVNTLHRMQFDRDMPLHSLVTHCSRKIHDALRKRPLDCRLMMGGLDGRERSSPVLYWVDDTGAVQKLRYGAHGREMALVLSVMDQLDREETSPCISHDSGMRIVKTCWLGVKRRSSAYLQSLALATSSTQKTQVMRLNFLDTN